jgi:small subunit ribosomal protein S8
MTDPIADLLTRIRNALGNGVATVDVPSSKVKLAICQVLKEEGYIEGFEIVEKPVQNDLRVQLKYGPRGERVIQHLQRVSRPGCRVYSKAKEMKPYMRGLGIYIVSTPQGVKSDRQAREAMVGGEVLAEVF